MPDVSVNGIRVHVEDQGSGAPLLFLPGLGLRVSECTRLLAPFTSRRRVLALDNRGAGLSDKPDGPYSIGLMAEDAAGAISALELARVDVMGISMGGKIAMALALAHPEQVRSLVLISTQARRPSPGQSRRIRGLNFAARLFGGSREDLAGRKRQGEASRDFDCWDDLSRIAAPTLVIHARGDRIASFALAEEMSHLIPGATLQAVSGGHVFPFMHPDELARPALAFLDRIDGDAASTNV